MQNDSNGLDGTNLAYLDFELEIGSGSGRDYPIAVVQSPAGEAQETMRFPFDELALASRLKDLQIALLRSGGARRQALSAEEEHVQAFGSELFNALLTGEVRSRYDVSGREARQQGKGLRLKLRIQPPELAALPWEFLYDPRQAEYVCLSLDTPLIRYIELPQPIQPLLITPPLRILGMIASPHDLPTLDVVRERQRLEAAVRDLQAKGLVTLAWLEGQTWYDLQRTLRSGPWHSEAVRLLHQKEDQAALAKWREVQTRDPQYPDTQMVQATATKKLAALAKEPRSRYHQLKWVFVLLTMAAFGVFLVWWFYTPPVVHDDFSDPKYDGRFNPEHWEIRGGLDGKVVQADGHLSITQKGAKDSERGIALIALKSISLPLTAPVVFETNILRENSENGGGGMSIHTNTGSYGCGISKLPAVDVIWWEEDVYGGSHKDIAIVDAELGKWYTCQAKFYPDEGRIEFYIDGQNVESRRSVEIRQLTEFTIGVSTAPGASGTLTFRFDDVRIGPIK